MLKHADISRYGKESLHHIPTILWNRHDVRVVSPALAEGQRSTVDEVYCICRGMKAGSENSKGDEIVSKGGRERKREVERQRWKGWESRGRDGGRDTGRENVPDSHGVY
ncbi:hypothetical protein QQF64_012169 [Cirrhinus molitorella]|uniref:Uncharacterized protein n=1 Tax=Cirrhinus molitorella TaxID=172907 RepID=A0ABR3LUS3_9TELE